MIVLNIKDYLRLDDRQQERFKKVYDKYKKLYEHPNNCVPMIVARVAEIGLPSWEERLADPLVMLKAELDNLRHHLEMEDDCVPTVRVEFGTAQIAAAFGCKIFIPPNSLPAAGSYVLKNSSDVYKLKMPSLKAGWYEKLCDYTEVFLENLPKGVHIQHPDIQSTFNTAHLIRGNDIFLDFYDDPEALCTLLDTVTDYMIKLVPYLKGMISSDREWFFDWGSMWKGTARISNCSMHMISPDFYRDYVLPRDMRLMESIGGGRIHYCGTQGEVIDYFFQNPLISGLDYDGNYHDLWDISKKAPDKVTLLQSMSANSQTVQRLLNGDWPEKRNIILNIYVSNIFEGKKVLKRLKESIPYV